MTTIKFRRDTSTNWTTANPIPAQGEPCYETDTGKLKIGNGSDYYSNLPYVSDGGGSVDLPIASSTTLGGIKVGNNLSIAEDGTLTTSVSTDDCLKTSQVANALNSSNGVYLRNNKLDTVQPKFYTADFGLATGNIGFINKVSYSATEPSDDEMTEAWTDMQGFFTYGTDAVTGFISGSVKFAPASSGSIQVVVKLLKENLIKGIDQNGSAKFSKFEISRNGTDYTEVTTFNGDTARYIRFTFDYDYSSYSFAVYAEFKTRIRVSWSYNDTFGASDTIALGVNYDDSTIKVVDGKLVASAPDNMVTTDTEQTISGSKTFDTLIASNIKTTANGTINLTHPANVASGLTTIENNYGQLSISNSSSNNNLFSIIRGSAYAIINGNLIYTTDVNGVRYDYISNQCIDTTYMKWDSTNGKLTVDTAAIAHLAMPSSTSVDLTLGATGTTYTAPADGYMSISATSNYTGWIKIDTRPGCYGYANSSQFLTSCPIVRDTSFKVWYSFTSGEVEKLQYTFIYCAGSVPSST